jgi:hypothetical protein
MAYTDFTLNDLEEKFGIKNRTERIFNKVKLVEPSEKLKDDLQEVVELPVRSEKAKSEWIVVPILRELRRRNEKFFTIYSGENLDVDKANGLNGECDFIIAKDIGTYNINYPIIQIVEAKKNDIDLGIPQCAAQLLGAKIYNQKKKTDISKIYGCVTTGNDWLFMCLDESLIIDTKIYYFSDLEEILGVLQTIIDYYKKV